MSSSFHEEGRTHCWGDRARLLGGDHTGLGDSVRRVQVHGFPSQDRRGHPQRPPCQSQPRIQSTFLKEPWANSELGEGQPSSGLSPSKFLPLFSSPAPPYLPLFSSPTWNTGVPKPAIRQGLSLGEAKPSSSFVISFKQDFLSASRTPGQTKGKRGSLA